MTHIRSRSSHRLTPRPPLHGSGEGEESLRSFPLSSYEERGPRGEAGTTLIELIVALAVLGIVLGVSTAALSAIHRDTPPPMAAAIAAARARALHHGSIVRVDLPDSNGHGVTSVLFLPDGRIIGVGFDPLTGEATDARR